MSHTGCYLKPAVLTALGSLRATVNWAESSSLLAIHLPWDQSGFLSHGVFVVTAVPTVMTKWINVVPATWAHSPRPVLQHAE